MDMECVYTAMQRMEKGDAHFRFVIDVNKSLAL
jgi:D-arabinose 1-dehydrogenase-like Zn-dependent alcohol dehydrogenase